jgi:hypothetical protein
MFVSLLPRPKLVLPRLNPALAGRIVISNLKFSIWRFLLPNDKPAAPSSQSHIPRPFWPEANGLGPKHGIAAGGLNINISVNRAEIWKIRGQMGRWLSLGQHGRCADRYPAKTL